MTARAFWAVIVTMAFGLTSILVWGWFGPFAGALWSTAAYFVGQMTAMLRRPHGVPGSEGGPAA